MNITRFSIKRPIGISMIFALIVVLGIFSFFRIGVELLPEVDSPYISVIVSYPGASTESVEQQVTKPIEDVFSSISHFFPNFSSTHLPLIMALNPSRRLPQSICSAMLMIRM